jgi:hypothetical protein
VLNGVCSLEIMIDRIKRTHVLFRFYILPKGLVTGNESICFCFPLPIIWEIYRSEKEATSLQYFPNIGDLNENYSLL